MFKKVVYWLYLGVSNNIVKQTSNAGQYLVTHMTYHLYRMPYNYSPPTITVEQSALARTFEVILSTFYIVGVSSTPQNRVVGVSREL